MKNNKFDSTDLLQIALHSKTARINGHEFFKNKTPYLPLDAVVFFFTPLLIIFVEVVRYKN